MITATFVQKNKQTVEIAQFSLKLKLPFLLLFVLTLNLGSHIVYADDSAIAPAFDMNTLASIASNLGSNPQVMNLVSNLLNSANALKPSLGGNSAAPIGSVPEQNGLSDQDPNSIAPQTDNAGQPTAPVSDPLRQLGSRLPTQQAAAIPQSPQSLSSLQPTLSPQPQLQQPQLPTAAPASPAVQQQPQQQSQPQSQQNTFKEASSPFGGFASMLPNLLPGLNLSNFGGMGGLGGLGNLFGLNKTPQTDGAQKSTSNTPQSQDNQTPAQLNQPSAPGTSTNTAQAVINQVLSAYVAGQIPSELIQLALSGRVPPQLVELALSGQVPEQMIQMIITGKVPMSTINAFLGIRQQNEQTRSPASTVYGTNNQTPAPSGIYRQSRKLFETLLGLGGQKSSSNGYVNVPTLFGPVPVRIPGLSGMRTFGKLVGGTISNVASLIPA